MMGFGFASTHPTSYELLVPSDRIQTAGDITSFIAEQPVMTGILRVVEAMGLPDCWIGAGFVRNAIWDALHDRPWSPSYGDVDVVYFESHKLSPDRDLEIENKLHDSAPGVPWSVCNQARMHTANGDPPYADTADALRHWPETCTAIAVRATDSGVELLAPFGVSDLVTLTVRPTPAFASKIAAYRLRIEQKRWTQRWPRLRIEAP